MPKLGKRVADLTLSASIPSIEAVYNQPPTYTPQPGISGCAALSSPMIRQGVHIEKIKML